MIYLTVRQGMLGTHLNVCECVSVHACTVLSLYNVFGEDAG